MGLINDEYLAVQNIIECNSYILCIFKLSIKNQYYFKFYFKFGTLLINSNKKQPKSRPVTDPSNILKACQLSSENA